MKKNLIKLVLVIFAGFLSINLCAGMLKVSEMCLENIKTDWASWIEIKNISAGNINLSGYKLMSQGKAIHECKGDCVIKSGEFLLYCFYAGNKIAKDFENKIPANVKCINILNSDVFSQNLGNLKPKTLDSWRKYTSTLKLRDIKDIIDKDGSAEIGDENDLIVCDSWNLAHCQPSIYNLYSRIAKKYCEKHGIPAIYKDYFVFKFYKHTLYAGTVTLLSSTGEKTLSIAWGRDSQQKNNIKLGRDPYLIGRKEHYLGYVCPNRNFFMPVYDFYNSSPGSEQTMKPLKDLKVSISLNHDTLNGVLNLSFFPFSFPLAKWKYEFEIASDVEFANILYSKKGTPKCFLGLGDLNFKLTKEQFEDLLWHPELYYRIRRILPDGYKTEWAGGECGKMMQQAYKNNIDYKAAMAVNKEIDKCMRLEKQKGKIEKDNKVLKKSITKTKNKQKITDLKKKIEENLNQIDELTQKIKDCDKKIWEMKNKNR